MWWGELERLRVLYEKQKELTAYPSLLATLIEKSELGEPTLSVRQPIQMPAIEPAEVRVIDPHAELAKKRDVQDFIGR